MRIRNAAVEGRFYPASKDQILQQIKEMELQERYPDIALESIRIIGTVLPHAGHLYSGHQTIPFFHLLRKLETYPETFIIVHPNHWGLGQELAIDDSDLWSNALGKVPLDRSLAEAMQLPFDHVAHKREHAAEVIIPFIQYFLSDQPFSIVPISMMDQSSESASRVALQIDRAVRMTGRSVLVIASCDFSHFQTPEEGANRDQFVLDEILSKNTAGVSQAVKQHQVSVCGYGPIMSLMEYARIQDKEYQVQILARGHSGEVISSKEVVDYISLIMYQ